MTHHGQVDLPGLQYACRHATASNGRFQRLFPDLPALWLDPRVLSETGAPGGPMAIGNGNDLGDSPNIPLGYCFLGQFIDHDITLDVSSSFDRVNDPEGIENVRTPVLDVDCVYGQGPVESRHQYWHSSSSQFSSSIQSDVRLRTGPSGDDLPRHEGAALIGDFRDDENRIVSQLQLVFIHLHNQSVRALLDDLNPSYAPRNGYQDHLRGIWLSNIGAASHELFEEARRLTRWHYQWVVVHDFLKRICGEKIVDDILCNGRKVYTCKSDPFIPTEFAVAAYRYGHTQVPDDIAFNGNVNSPLFRGALGIGFDRLPNGIGGPDWRLFFGSSARPASAIDIALAESMLDLPFVGRGGESSLATRNMLRSQSFQMPSGQAVADEIERITGEQFNRAPVDRLDLPVELHHHTPLWLYILAEGYLSNGETLGTVGGRLVAEVLIGLLECDPTSWLGSNRNWVPEFMRDTRATWDMEALINFATQGDYATP